MEEENKPIEDNRPEFEKKLDEMRAENERLERNLNELKQLKALEALGGKTNINGQPEPPKQETPLEYRRRIEQEMKEGKLK